ncbi:MAG TPA: class IV adenylate cyclase, partial [Pirellulales bacterium]
YFNHPARDFAQTDEALRLRQVGQLNFITYKGPKLAAATKTRREIELPLPAGAESSAGFAEILTSLGFRAVAEVRKIRRQLHVEWAGREVEIALDDVAGVGQYVELELIATENELESAQAAILSLADRLQLGTSERRSYLELLLANRASNESAQ